MNLKLVYHPSKILQKPCVDVLNPQGAIRLAAAMHTLMKKNKGIGLAAPQIGKCVRLIVVDTLHAKNGHRLSLINPEILSSQDRAAKIEGCLSFPGVLKYINRPTFIELAWTDFDGNRQFSNFSGLTAQVIQHEIDHLNGITFIDERAGT